ncbi:MAG: transporter substrate-binding domain-containing protein, partial [Pseudomonadota bacterium]|nr:transporter substrate-binding domain-containing protein [Pseudomonadota bacterium]
MKLRRYFLLASLTVLTFATGVAQAQSEPLKVGTDATFPPMEFVEDSKRTGFDIEMVESVGKVMG